jgi:hypothetical protein
MALPRLKALPPPAAISHSRAPRTDSHATANTGTRCADSHATANTGTRCADSHATANTGTRCADSHAGANTRTRCSHTRTAGHASPRRTCSRSHTTARLTGFGRSADDRSDKGQGDGEIL